MNTFLTRSFCAIFLLFFCPNLASSKTVSLIIALDGGLSQEGAGDILEQDMKHWAGDQGWRLVDPSSVAALGALRVGFFYLSPDDFRYWSNQPNGILARFLRAFRERGLNTGVYWIFSDLPLSVQRESLARLIEGLKSRGFKFDNVAPRLIIMEPPGLLWLRRVIVLLIAVVVPLSTLTPTPHHTLSHWEREQGRGQGEGVIFLVFLLLLLTGMFTWLLLQTDAFKFQLSPLYIVQIVFLLPFILLAIFQARDGYSHLLVFLLAMAVAFVALERSAGRWPVFSGEYYVRDWLDVNIGIRPRIKELFGWFCWSFIWRQDKSAAKRWTSLALFGPVATMNSFLHAHTPLGLIAVRSAISMLAAYAAAASVHWFFKRKNI
ncbi:MAG: hypothetical protein HY747_10040 [Elusimicrobia bacterium]|nr:hypothetical protein [Elusimicrobiota bacterium]